MDFWKRILGIARPFRLMLAFSLAMTAVSQLIGFLPMLAQKSFFDTVGEWMRGTQILESRIYLTIAFLVGAAALSEVVSSVSGIISDLLQSRMSLKLDDMVAKHLLWLSLGYHTRHETAEKTSVVSRGLNETQMVIGLGLARLLPTVCTAVVYASWSFLIAPGPGAAMIAGSALVFLYALVMGRRMRGARKEYREAWKNSDAHRSDVFRNIRLVKSSATERFVLGDIVRYIEALREHSDRLSVRLFWVGNVQTLLRHATTFAVLTVAGWEMLRGNATLGTMTLMFGATQQLGNSIEGALRILNAIERSRTHVEELFKLLDEKPDILPPANPIPLGTMRGSVTFEDVSFSYPDTDGTIRSVSFHVPAGKTVAIVGPSGAGKTTLTTLLLRGFDVDAGRVLIDGKDVRLLDPVEYLSQVGVVAQGSGLFSTSVRKNIAFGQEGVTQDAIEAAARMAGAHDFILALQEGYDTQVGENGARISGGQAQRICIARALLRNPRLLILDEATSHLDERIEEQILEEIVPRINGSRTVVIIAHRLSTIRNADIVVVLDQGRIVQQGPFDKVRQEPGPFVDMFRLQLENASL